MRRPSKRTERILYHLARAEYREPNPWFQDDIRIAWITVLYASYNYPQPFVTATYQVLGIHPDKVAAAIEARTRAVLGPCYELFYPRLPPKKPSTSAFPKARTDDSRKVSGE